MADLIAVRHNIEVAHRLFELPGKCENIHGHSMWVTLWIKGAVNEQGVLNGIEFGALKKDFRQHLDDDYDHHLLLNKNDPWASVDLDNFGQIPGLQMCPGDPTTENIARWIADAMKGVGYPVSAVDVWETAVNCARYEID